MAGPRELDLAGHGGWREEEEGGEAARRWSSGGTCRPESSWERGVVTGGGRFGPGGLDSERAEEAAALRLAEVSWRLGEASGMRVRVRRCQGASQVVLGGFSGPFGRGRAMDEVHRRRTAGGGRNRASREERDGGKLKISPT